jgi:hypothetical protein
MYHICSAECQIQFVPRKTTDNGEFPVSEPAASGCGQLGDAVVPGPGRVDQGNDRFAVERRLDLAEPANQRAGLAGERQSAGSGGKEQAIDVPGETGLDRHLSLKLLLEEAPLLGGFDERRRRGHPDAAPGKLVA